MGVSADPEDRRRQVVSAALDLLAREGLAAVTVRNVARLTGFSTAIVSHYFASKEELIYLTFKANIDAAERRSEAAAKSGGIREYIKSVLPLDEARHNGWKVWLAYMGQVVVQPELAEIQRGSAQTRIERSVELLDAMAARGEIRPGLDHLAIAERLLSFVMGMSLQVLFAPDAWPRDRQLAALDRELAEMCGYERAARPSEELAPEAAAEG